MINQVNWTMNTEFVQFFYSFWTNSRYRGECVHLVMLSFDNENTWEKDQKWQY